MTHSSSSVMSTAVTNGGQPVLCPFMEWISKPGLYLETHTICISISSWLMFRVLDAGVRGKGSLCAILVSFHVPGFGVSV